MSKTIYEYEREAKRAWARNEATVTMSLTDYVELTTAADRWHQIEQWTKTAPNGTIRDLQQSRGFSGT